MATKPAKITSKLAYTGKGKKVPQLPAGVIAALTIGQSGVSHELAIIRTAGQLLIDKKSLLTALSLKPTQVKELPVVELGDPAAKKKQEFYSVGNAVIAAGVAHAVKGGSPVSTWLLNIGLTGVANRLIDQHTELAAPVAAE